MAYILDNKSDIGRKYMHELYDVIVVGSGPSGSYSALCCAESGLKTLLLDGAKFPRAKPCGGILEAKYFIRFAPFLTDQAENVTHYTSLYYNNKKLFVRLLKSYIYSRKNFDQLLVDHAISAGVEFHDCSKVFKLSEAQNNIVITWHGIKSKSKKKTEHHAKARFCIGADGVNSIVRKYMGLGRFIRPGNRLQTLIIEDAEPKDDRIWEITTEFDEPAIASYFFSGFPGFAWVAPKKDSVNVGIGTLVKNSQNLKSMFRQFLTQLNLNLKLKKLATYPIPIMPAKYINSGRIMLVGDAAGIVNPWTGGGINLGFQSAKMAAATASAMINSKCDLKNKNAALKYYKDQMKHTLKMLRLKGNLLKSLAWFIRHKAINPQIEYLILKYFFPRV